MELYQVVAIAVMIAMGLVVNSTLKLNHLRKKNGVVRTAINLRDLAVFRQPQNFDAQEVYLVRSNWIACATLFALVLLMLAVSPDDLPQKVLDAFPQ
jgi:hypothetical protein